MQTIGLEIPDSREKEEKKKRQTRINKGWKFLDRTSMLH